MSVFTFSSKLWIFTGGKVAWYFITLPKKDSEQIRFMHGHMRRGFGSVRVTATIGKTSWKTSVFPDSKKGAYVLPIKADVRKKENLAKGKSANVKISLDL